MDTDTLLVRSVNCRRISVGTASGTKQVLVAAPLEDEVVSEETLAELRSGTTTRLHHEVLAEQVRAQDSKVDAIILRGRGADGSGQFRLSRALDDAQLEEAGYLLAREQLKAWRPMLSNGVLAIARVELRVWELTALRSGIARLMAELKTRAHSDPEAAADVKLLETSVLNFGVGLTTAIDELLPERLEAAAAAKLG